MNIYRVYIDHDSHTYIRVVAFTSERARQLVVERHKIDPSRLVVRLWMLYPNILVAQAL